MTKINKLVAAIVFFVIVFTSIALTLIIQSRLDKIQTQISLRFDQIESKVDARLEQIDKKLDHFVNSDKREFLAGNPPYSAISSEFFSNAKSVSCSAFAQKSSAIIIVAGQSNSGNYAETKGLNSHGENIANYYSGQCRVASDPLMGADGDSGSPWIRMANKLVDMRKFDRVLIVPVSVGGSSMARWRQGGDLRFVLETQIKRLNALGIPATHVLWVQGEADRFQTSRYRLDGGVRYHDDLLDLAGMVTENTAAKFYITLTSSCTNDPKAAREIKWAQKEVILSLNNGRVLQGPDLDKIKSKGDRYDACHLSDQGVGKFADGWIKILVKQ